MPRFLERLSPAQRQLVLIGVPVVAFLAIVTIVRGREPDVADEEEDAGPATTGPVQMPSTNAIGVGQLADFESNLTNVIRDFRTGFLDFATEIEETVANPPGLEELEEQVSGISKQLQTIKKPPAPPAPKPKPKPRKKARKGCSSPPRPTTLQPGERITDKVVTSDGCGALYLTDVGGVHTAGKLPSGAPVHLRGKGSIPGIGPPHTTPGNRPFVRIEWFGPKDRHGQRGYRIWNAKGQTWEFV